MSQFNKCDKFNVLGKLQSCIMIEKRVGEERETQFTHDK